MNKKILFYLVSFLLLISLAFASDSCFSEGCAGQQTAANVGKNIIYSGNILNKVSNSSYNTCILPSSTYTSTATDMNNDNLPDYIITENNQIEIYDSSCSLLATISAPNLKTMPIVTNFNSNDKQEITFATNDTLYVYEFNAGYLNMTVVASKFYYSDAGNVSINQLICSRQFDNVNNLFYCVGVIYGSSNLMQFNYSTTNNIISDGKKNSVLSFNMYNTAVLGTTQGFSSQLSIAGICGINFNNLGTQMSCDAISMNDLTRLFTTGNLISPSTAVTSFNRLTMLPIGTGSSYRWLMQADFIKAGSNTHSDMILSNTFQNNFNFTSGVQQFNFNESSNIMVGDYNYDGSNELCYFQNNSNTSDIFFRCLNSGLINIVNINYTGVISSLHKHYVMAQFYSNRSTLGIADNTGIFYDGIKVVSFPTSTVSYYYSPMIVQYPLSGGILMSFASTGTTITLQTSTVIASCGDGVCQSFESPFSCAADCGQLNNGTCFSDSDCSGSYPTCWHSSCVAGYSGISCIDGSQCPLNSSVCNNGICIAAIFQQATTPQNPDLTGNPANPSIIWNLIFGGSLLWRFVIGIILMLVIFGISNNAINPKHDPLTTSIIFACSLTIFVISQFISTWTVILIIILAGATFVLRVVLFPGNSSEQ